MLCSSGSYNKTMCSSSVFQEIFWYVKNKKSIYILVFCVSSKNCQLTQMKKNVNTRLEDRQQRIRGSQHEVLLISCIIGWVTTRQLEINEFKTESIYKIEIYQLNSQVFLKNRENDEEGAVLIYDRGHLCKEKPQQGQDGEGLTPALIMGHFQMKSRSIRAGGHSNSPLCHSKTWNGNWSHGHGGGGMF